jgi:KDO2-lipid IV(A) lauroyltransferase
MRAMPELDAAAAKRIIGEMWNNLGRVAAEYPHLHAFRLDTDDRRIEIIGAEHIDRFRADGIGGIFFSGHLANWEILSLAAGQSGMPLAHIYRRANNPRVEALIQRVRTPVPGRYWPKGAAGARELVTALRHGEHLGMLVDQKMNNGIAVPFFGRPAMTAPAAARLALRFQCPIVPARVERLEGARFRLTVFPPLEIEKTADAGAETLRLMTEVNRILEGWIRERPAEWLWLHRRWPD